MFHQSHTFFSAVNNADDAIIPMNAAFSNESQSRYLFSAEARAPHCLLFKDGILVTASNGTVCQGSFLYVIDKNNILYGVPRAWGWNHSFLLAGGPVKAAGFIETDTDGELLSVSNESGHYTPTTLAMLPALRYFNQHVSHDAAVLYESHDEAKVKGVIHYYSLSDIVKKITNDRDLFKLPQLVQSSYLKAQSADQSVTLSVVGYDAVFDVDPAVETQTIFSRYGLAPKKHH